ncbi:Kinesin-like protein [Dirofilaria immitis]
MELANPNSAIRTVLNKFPTDENAKDSMEKRDMAAQQIHINIVNIIEQMNNLKPFYNEQLNANVAEKEHLSIALHELETDIGKRKSYLKEEEVELEDLQQCSEIQRNIAKEQKRQLELLKIAEMANKESWIGNITDRH